ncbi:MAG: mechanosensitive ion channel family protein [Deltaproteobacteria bacterium]|nr:mechanosensitive ion channel family protein [Deltaproteobacteria bacterium]
MPVISIPADSSTIKAFLVFSAVFIISSAVLLIIRKFSFRYFYRWAEKTETRLDDIILDSVRHPSIFWALAISLYIALDSSPFHAKYVSYGLTALYVLIVLSVTLAAANISSRAVQNAVERSTLSMPLTGLSRTVIRVIIFAIGALIVLNSLGLSITPLLTALGVGGLAVALALQDTLSNLFAGIHILAEKSIKLGDYIRMSTGEEGYVADIGWRTTKIRELSNNIIIIPNNKLSQSIITNYSMPEKRTTVTVKVRAGADTEPERVEAVLKDEAVKASGSVKGLLTEPAAGVNFNFGDSWLEFTLVCHVAEYTDQTPVQNELRKRIFKRFKQEGIEMPFHVKTVQIKG